jgi:hypothetical protein
VWKFPLAQTDEQVVSMPEGAIILHVGEQQGQLCLWALIVPDAPKVDRHIIIRGTGRDLPHDVGPYIGSVLMHGGSLVLHVFGAAVPPDRWWKTT